MRHTGSEGLRLKEGSHINKSLMTLATVIGKLSDGGDRFVWRVRAGKQHSLTLFLRSSWGCVLFAFWEGGRHSGHIPFRDSKLTRILQSSLGGNARTMIICTMSPALAYMDESHSTLKFASRAKDIKNKPHVNEVVSDEALLRRYQNEIVQLRQQLAEVRAPSPGRKKKRPPLGSPMRLGWACAGLDHTARERAVGCSPDP